MLYGAAPAWVQRLFVPAASADQGGSVQVLLLDRQVTFSEDGADYYRETAYKALTTQGLQDLGTLGVVWDPVLDDLTINAAQIIRGGQTIDLLANAQDFRVLQRETGLPEATLDGQLTAIKEIHDLRVGDVILFATTLHIRKPIVGAPAEDAMKLTHTGVAEHIRYRAIWPKAMNVRWKNTSGIEGVTVRDRGDTRELVYDASRVTKPRPPSGAPIRYDNLGRLELTGFGSWKEISRLFAPMYVSASGLPDNSPVKAEAARIKAENTTDAARAMAALRLVEDQVRYLALALGEGGLTPTPADETWRRRFGDCKAKTALLMALFRELGIKADPILIATVGGEGLPDQMPRISAFNHIILRAEIGGKTYWLDGTRTGDRSLTNIVPPPFGYGLPVTASGSDLQKIVRERTNTPTAELRTTINMANGIDKEGSLEITQVFRGELGLAWERAANAVPRAEMEQSFIRRLGEMYSWAKISSVTFSYDAERSEYRVVGLGTGHFEWDNALGLPRAGLGGEYTYEVAKRGPLEDKDAPYGLDFPFNELTVMRIVLPKGGAGFAILGFDVDATWGGKRIQRASAIKDGVAELSLYVQTVAPEVTPQAARAAEERFATLPTANGVVLLAGLPEFNPGSSTSAPASSVSAAAQKALNGDTPGALTDLDAIIRRYPSDPTPYGARASIYVGQKKFEPALTDARKAISLRKDNVQYHSYELFILLKLGRHRDAIAAMDDLAKSRTQAPLATGFARGCALVGLGRPAEAITALDAALAQSNETTPWICSLDDLSEILAGMPEAARSDFDTALSAKPASPMARLIKGHMLESRDPRLAAVQYDEAVRLKPDWKMARQERINANIKSRTLRAALVDLDWLVEQGSVDESVFQTRADIYLSLNNIPQAVENYTAAINLAPASPALFYARCSARAAAGIELDQALEDCNEALRLRPTLAEAYDSRGLVYLRLQRPANAVADFDVSLASSDRASSRYGRGLAKRAMGDEPGAAADIEAAVKLKADIAATFSSFGLTR